MPICIDEVIWKDCPDRPGLTAGAIHLWRVQLDAAADLGRMSALLSAEELARMRRYHHQRDANRFAIARGALRQVLGRYLDVAAQDVQIGYGPHGKPVVQQAADGRVPLHFNISHSENLALMAFVLGREIGIDIEFMRDGVDIEGVSAAFMSAPERQEILPLRSPEKSEIFYRYWVCKEAYLKARGTGMVLSPRSFAISLEGSSPALLQAPSCDPEPQNWSFAWVDVGDDFRGALACAGQVLPACEFYDFR